MRTQDVTLKTCRRRWIIGRNGERGLGISALAVWHDDDDDDDYSPTNVSEETDLIAFYNELSSLVRSIPKYIVLIISGDINAQIGKNVNNEFSLHNSSNGNGEHLKDFTLENRLIYLHTNFRKERENYGPTPTQIILKNRWSTSLSIRNGMIERWIAIHIPLSRVCPPITELSRQRYDWAYEGMRPNNHNRSLRLVAA